MIDEIQRLLDSFEHECFMIRVEGSETRAKVEDVRKAYLRQRNETAKAIEAMLEPETCCFEFDQEASDRCQGDIYSCDKCGALSYTDRTNVGKFKFCPNCRRRVKQ